MLGISSNGKGSHDVVHVDYVSCLNCFRNMFKICSKLYTSPVLHPYLGHFISRKCIFSHFKVLGEFFYVVTRVTVKAQRRKNERKMEKAKLLEKPLLPPANDGEEKV